MTEHYVRPDVKAFLAMLNAMPGPRMHEAPVEVGRTQYVQMRDMVEPPIGELAEIRDLTIPGPGGPIPARLYDAKASREPGPALVFFHGGGFTVGNLDTHASFTAEVARALDLPVIAVDYRLAPEAKWPAAPIDAEAAARWVAGSPAELGRSVTSLVLMGDSAGGNLTITTAVALRDRPAAVRVIVQVPIYPATDSSKPYESFDLFADGGFLLTRDSLKWFEDHYAADPADPRTSPLLGDLAGLPPALVITASLDPIRDQGRAYAAALALAGVPVTFREMVGTIHGFITLRQAIPSAAGDVALMLALAKPMITAAEADRVMLQAAGKQPVAA
jgi:acetyl esterase